MRGFVANARRYVPDGWFLGVPGSRCAVLPNRYRAWRWHMAWCVAMSDLRKLAEAWADAAADDMLAQYRGTGAEQAEADATLEAAKTAFDQAILSLLAERDAARAAVEQAALWFDEYVILHRLKGTKAGEEKAYINERRAAYLRASAHPEPAATEEKP